ncbi:acyl-CoA thioesterase [Moraxella sp. VT-16-12]|uniref:acyl-CoA thioesterase n=1 Tax=Moraxella sp. VT-16-12 TaxID=2014877 RepID=UPI000B7F3E15|nr:acyl-CoA thioesterase [Moraxella sp. VT-16-12]TWV81550.1 acyl-CoA thioesterase [Moraxella sp. VT-16-12]
MYPFLRLTKTLLKSSLDFKKGNTLSLHDTAEFYFTARFNDIDNFLEMNNGRIFTLFDLGRTDFAIRTGLGKKLLQKRWGLVVAGSTIQYRKRIRAFDKVVMKTRVAAIDERWFYIEQTMWVNHKCTCHALLRTAVTNIKTGKVIDTNQVMQSLGYHDISLPPDEWVQAWIDADKLRPFPH